MKRNLSLSIDKPCSEKFDRLQPIDAGGFCNSCQKEVIDFTKMSDQEVLQYFKSNSQKTCGYFRKSQLKTYPEIITSRRRLNFNFSRTGLASFSLLAFLSITNGQAQQNEQPTAVHATQDGSSNRQNTDSKVKDEEHIVEGIVIDESGNPLPGTVVVLKGTTIGTFTGDDGRFTFPQPLKKGDTLIFNYIGFETKKFVVSKDAPIRIDMKMKFSVCDLVFMGEVTTDQVYVSKRSLWQKVKGTFR